MGEPARKIEIASPWLRISEAAAYCRLSLATLKRHIAQGTLKPDSPARPGLNRNLFRRETLDKWLLGTSENDNG